MVNEPDEKETETRKEECFVIAPLGDVDSPARARTKKVIEHLIEPAVEGKYEVITADQIMEPGSITMQIIEKIATAPILIADLTDNNANVYYELSCRQALRLPAILMVLSDQIEKVAFDIQGLNVILYDFDVDMIEDAIRELKQHIQAVEENRDRDDITDKHMEINRPKGPHDHTTLIELLLIANRFRHELIEPYFDPFLAPYESSEARILRLKSVFSSVMRESARKQWLQKNTALSAFTDRSLRDKVAGLFHEVETIIGPLSDAIEKQNEDVINTQLTRWRRNNTEFLCVWSEQYQKWVDSCLPETCDK